MNSRAKRRLAAVTVLIVIAIAALSWFTRLGDATATPVSVADALADSTLVGTQIEVTGEVVPGSWNAGAMPFEFDIRDSGTSGSGKLTIVWEQVIPSSFGDGTTATVTGKLGEDGTIVARTLVTQCPSKYESATNALTVADARARATELVGVTLKVTGHVAAGTIADPGADPRFGIADGAAGVDVLDVSFAGALPDDFAEGVQVVLTGSLREDGGFECTGLAIAESAR